MLTWLKEILGDHYTEDVDKKVSEQIGKDFVARVDFNNLNTAKKTADEDLKKVTKERDDQLENLKKVNPEGLRAEIEKLQGENKTAKEQYETELKRIKIESLLESRLIKEQAVNAKAVRSLLDMTKISVDGDNLIGIDDQLKALKASEPWAFKAQTKPPKSGAPLGGKEPNADDGPTMNDEIKSAMYGSAASE